MDVRQQDNMETRIVEAAGQLFVEKGFEETSMSDIAAEVGINRTALHYYFRTKEKMFQAVFGDLIQEFLPRMQVIFLEDKPLMEKIERVIDTYFEIFRDNPSLPKFILSEVQRDVDHLLEVGRKQHIDQYLRAIEAVLVAEMQAGNIKRVPMQVILVTFFSQLTFPFLAKNLVISLFYETEEEYQAFLTEWKQVILRHMKALLMP